MTGSHNRTLEAHCRRERKRVVLIGDRKKPEVARLVDELEPWLREQVNLVGIDLTGHLDLRRLKADFLIVLGGDGSILSAARRLGKNIIPVVGVNLGKFGFLANYSAEELKKSLNEALKGKHEFVPRMMLACVVLRKGKNPERFRGSALNDVVISRGSISRMIYLKLSVAGKELTVFGGDGLIIATPVGSTAHSLAAGGPILHPMLKAFLITPICAHTLTMRPLVVPTQHEITVEPVPTPSVRDGAGASAPGQTSSRQEVVLTIDGQVFMYLHPEDRVVINAEPHMFHLIEPSGHAFYDTLREKLLWGGQVKRRTE